MSSLPYLFTENGRTALIVDDQPFLILGGELHNSSGSDLRYLEEKVWPGLRNLGGNCYLTPVYWECMEPEKDQYDFTLVDGIIGQARREGVRLILLWFGLWKNGKSEYIPRWMKNDPAYFYMQDEKGTLLESVSPFCQGAIERDRIAFTRLMAHLKETDDLHTVIMMQVENEIGVWGHERDHSPAASAVFAESIPQEMAELFETDGTWEKAFGEKACEYFMAWAFSSAVGKISGSGAAVHPLPFFMNCVAIGLPLPAGQHPSGEPLPRVHKIWRRFAPQIALYGPDIYSPFYHEVCDEFAQANALFIPEMGQDINTASKALYTVAAYNTICFSPFGIDGMMTPLSENDLLSQMNTGLVFSPPEAGIMLAEAYRILRLLWADIRAAQEKGDCFAFLEQKTSDPSHDVSGADFECDDVSFHVTFGTEGLTGFMGQSGHRKDDRPLGGGFILRTGLNEYLLCGIAFNLLIDSLREDQQVFIERKQEFRLQGNELMPGRILNGDERNFTAIGCWPSVQKIRLYKRQISKARERRHGCETEVE